MKVYAVINQKGGVGKTTTVANLGAAIAARRYPGCLIDLDPQGHLTLHFGIEPATPDKSVYDVITNDAEIASAALMVVPGLWVVPSTIDLAAAEMELAARPGREQILRDRLRTANLPYQFVMIDCPPSLGLLTLNALAAADEVLIPLQPHFLALQGLGKLLETIAIVRRRINPKLRVAGVIFCMYETATRLAAEVADDVRAFFESARDSDAPWSGARTFRTQIRRNVKLAECPSHGLTIFDYDPRSHGAEDYLALAEEFLTTSDIHAPVAMQAAPAGASYVSDASPAPGAPEPQASPAVHDLSNPAAGGQSAGNFHRPLPTNPSPQP